MLLKNKMIGRMIFLLLNFFNGAFLFAQSGDQVDFSVQYIRYVKIYRNDIFDTSQAKFQKFPFPLINKLHIKTHHRVIERELLFNAGEPVDSLLLAESERNLRALKYIGSAQIVPVKVGADSTDVKVTVSDQWTTTVGTKYEVQGGYANYGIRLEEHNLLGWGQKIKFSVAQIDRRWQQEFSIQEKRLFNSWLQVGYELKNYEYGKLRGFYIKRPFFSVRTNWSAELTFNQYNGQRTVYRNEIVHSRYHSNEMQWNARASYLLYQRANISGRFSFVYSQFNEAPNKIQFLNDEPVFDPHFDDNRMLGIGFDWINLRYIKESFVNNFGMVEDISLGSSGGFYLGKTLRYSGVNKYLWYVQGRLGHALKFANSLYLSADMRNYFYLNENNFEQLVTQLEFKSYFNKFHSQTLAFNTRILLGWRMPPNRQLFLGENRGIRGYANYFRTGQKRVVINLEDRIYPRIFIYSFGIGAAVFTDVGYIWDGRYPVNWRKPFASAGLGLRIGNTKVRGAKVFRIDAAIVLTDDRAIMFSFGNSHYFSAFDAFDWLSQFPQKYGEYRD